VSIIFLFLFNCKQQSQKHSKEGCTSSSCVSLFSDTGQTLFACCVPTVQRQRSRPLPTPLSPLFWPWEVGSIILMATESFQCVSEVEELFLLCCFWRNVAANREGRGIVYPLHMVRRLKWRRSSSYSWCYRKGSNPFLLIFDASCNRQW
jgi:hypothetical protein